MAIDTSKYKNEIFMPGSSDSRWDTMENDYADNILRNIDKTLFDDLGIDTSKPQAEKDSKGNLILYQMDEDGKISNPFEDGDLQNSYSFLEKIAQGKIFAYPAGQKDPVQLQLDYDHNPPELTYSKPMTENIYPKPRPLSFWTRVKAFFGGAKEEVREYNESMKRYETSSSAKEATESSRSKDVLDQEKKEYEKTVAQKKAEEAEALRREQQERLRTDAGSYRSKVDRSMDLMQDIYGPQPVKKEEQIGCQYTNAQFAHLKSYDTGDIKIGGETISDRQFMGVAMAAVFTPDCGGSVRAYDELSPEENMAANNTFYTSDLFAWAKAGRASVGQYFEKAQGPAREKAYQALQEYKNGNKEPLGTLIGNALHFSATKLEHYNVKSDAYLAPNAALAQTVSILEQDPELKELAMKAGMSESDLNVARADLAIAKQYRENEWAEGRLEEDIRAREGDPDARLLSEDDKKFCVDAKLKYQVLDQASKLHKTEREKSDEYSTEIGKVLAERALIDAEHQKVNKAHNKGQMSDEEYNKQRAEFKRQEEINSVKIKNVDTSVIGMPKELKGLGTAAGKGSEEEFLNKLVDSNLPNKNMLYNMDSKTLSTELELNKLFAKNSPYMPAPEIKEVPKVDAPAKTVQQAEKTVKNEAVAGGPVA